MESLVSVLTPTNPSHTKQPSLHQPISNQPISRQPTHLTLTNQAQTNQSKSNQTTQITPQNQLDLALTRSREVLVGNRAATVELR